MLPLANIEEINEILLAIPSIVESYESQDSTFAERVKNWLRYTEDLLINNRLPVAGALAALRAAVISAERGAIPSGVVFLGQTSPRKLRETAAAESLRRAQELVSEVVRADWSQLEDARRVIRQVITLGRYKGHLDVPGDINYSDYVQLVWARFHADADLAQGVVRVTSSVGFPNALALLGQELPAPGSGARI